MHPELLASKTTDPLGTHALLQSCIKDLERWENFYGGTPEAVVDITRAGEAVQDRLDVQCSKRELADMLDLVDAEIERLAADRNAYDTTRGVARHVIAELLTCLKVALRGKPHAPRIYESQRDVARLLDAHTRMAGILHRLLGQDVEQSWY